MPLPLSVAAQPPANEAQEREERRFGSLRRLYGSEA
jgi:hypothetical protein